MYWIRIHMAGKARGHYGPSFQSHRGATQGDHLSPMIFNVIVDAVIQQWVTIVGIPQEGAGQEVLRTPIHTLSALFYANNGLFASSESARPQGAVDALKVLLYALTGLFNRVGLQNNEVKMVSMACWTCHTPHEWSTEDYTWRVTGGNLASG